MSILLKWDTYLLKSAMEQSTQIKQIYNLLKKDNANHHFYFFNSNQHTEIINNLKNNFKRFSLGALSKKDILIHEWLDLLYKRAFEYEKAVSGGQIINEFEDMLSNFWNDESRRDDFYKELAEVFSNLPKSLSLTIGLTNKVRDPIFKTLVFDINKNFRIRGLARERCGFTSLDFDNWSRHNFNKEDISGDYLGIECNIKGVLNSSEKLLLEKDITIILMLLYILNLVDRSYPQTKSLHNFIFVKDDEGLDDTTVSPELSFTKSSFVLSKEWNSEDARSLGELLQDKAKTPTYLHVIEEIALYFQKRKRSMKAFQTFENLLMLFNIALGSQQINVQYMTICSILENLAKVDAKDWVNKDFTATVIAHKIANSYADRIEVSTFINKIFVERNNFIHRGVYSKPQNTGDYSRAIKIIRSLLKEYFYELTSIKTRAWI